MSTAIALFTRDLRVRDNPVLAAATASASSIVPLFVLDPRMLSRTAHGRPNRFGFLCQSLVDLDGSLSDQGGTLVVRRGDWVREVLQVAYESGATAVHIARDVSGYAQRRLAQLQERAVPAGIEVVVHDAVTVVPPDAFGKPYFMFTPYYRKWITAEWRAVAPRPRKLSTVDGLPTSAIPDASPPGEWVGGETAGLTQFKAWTPRGLAHYGERRDDPAADATARLSPYFHLGCVSPLDVASRLYDRKGAAEFLRQLCRRDFFAQLLWWRPDTARADVRPSASRRWRDDPGDLAAWKEGRTGYPLVDAGMRQLLGDGWMHNRVRMVAASFLTTDLRIDWRVGAAHFMELLVDGDVASNQLNWQWVAGTGADTNPNRVLDPTVQARRFDQNGEFARRWIPELDTARYPRPIVDHKEAIAEWRAARG